MSVGLGADPSALDELATAMRAVAGDLAARPRWHRGDAARGWSGPDALQVGDLLAAAARERMRAADLLMACSRRIARAALEQRRASRSVPDATVLVDQVGGGGRLVQRIGPAAASVVVVVVPGIGTDRGDRARLRADAARVWSATADRMDDPTTVAVVSWLGYDPPDRLWGALDVGPATDGAAALRRTVEDLRDDGATTVVVLGHSYGGVVAGRAAAHGLRARVVVQVGSPGSGEPGAAAAMQRRGVELRAVRERGDPIGFVAGRLPGLYGEDVVGVVGGLATSGTGHSAYLSDPVLLDALADLVLRYRRDP